MGFALDSTCRQDEYGIIHLCPLFRIILMLVTPPRQFWLNPVSRVCFHPSKLRAPFHSHAWPSALEGFPRSEATRIQGKYPFRRAYGPQGRGARQTSSPGLRVPAQGPSVPVSLRERDKRETESRNARRRREEASELLTDSCTCITALLLDALMVGSGTVAMVLSLPYLHFYLYLTCITSYYK